MASLTYIGNAPTIAQITAFVFGGTWETTDVITLTIGTKTVTTTAGSTTITAIVDALVTLWNDTLDAESYPEFAEMTASRSSNSLVLTMDTDHAGKPFTVTIATTETGGGGADAQTIDGGASSTGTNSTANSGPNVVSLAGNWSTNTAPVDGDDLYFDHGDTDVLYDLDQNAITPASITISEGYRGRIGLPLVNEDDANNPYNEYRPRYLKYGNSGDATNIALKVKGGGGRLKLDFGTSQFTARIENTGTPIEQDIPTLLLKGTHASNALHVSKGNVGVAFFGGETSTLLTLNVGYRSEPQGDSNVKLGAGVTLTAPTIQQTGGELEVNSAITSTSTVTILGGTYYQLGTGGIAAGLSVQGGTCVYSTNGTLGGNPIVSGEGHLDFSQDLRTKTVTNPIEVYGDKARVSDPNKVTGSVVVDLNQGANSDNINLGTNIRLTRGTPS